MSVRPRKGKRKLSGKAIRAGVPSSLAKKIDATLLEQVGDLELRSRLLALPQAERLRRIAAGLDESSRQQGEAVERERRALNREKGLISLEHVHLVSEIRAQLLEHTKGELEKADSGTSSECLDLLEDFDDAFGTLERGCLAVQKFVDEYDGAMRWFAAEHLSGGWPKDGFPNERLVREVGAVLGISLSTVEIEKGDEVATRGALRRKAPAKPGTKKKAIEAIGAALGVTGRTIERGKPTRAEGFYRRFFDEALKRARLELAAEVGSVGACLKLRELADIQAATSIVTRKA